MAAVWRSVSALSDQLGADLTVTKPSGTVDGDLLIAIGRCSGAASITKPDSSWDDSFSLSVAAPFFWKIASSEGSNYTFVVSGATTTAEVSIVRIDGHHPTTPLDDVKAVTGAGALVIPAVTSAGADRLLMQMCVKLGTGNTWSGPGSQTERYDTTSSNVNFTYAGGDEVVGSGSTGTRTWTPSSGGATSVGYMAAIAPIVNATVNAVTSTATAAGVAPTVSGGASVAAVAASATSLAVAPAVSGGAIVGAVAATATADAPTPTVSTTGSPAVDAPTSEATATALAPTVAGQQQPVVTAVTTTATAQAHAPTVTGNTGADTLIEITATEGGRRRWGGRK